MKKETQKKQSFKVALALARYPEEVVALSCYKFLENFYFKLSGDNKKIIVEAFLREKKPEMPQKHFEEDFYTELNHNLVRVSVAKENKKLREMVVFQSFFSALPEAEKEKLVLSENKTKDNFEFDDPLGIAVPWEKKYGDKPKKKKR